MRLVGNCLPISIYLGTMCWKGTGNELQASKLFWMTSIIFSGKSNYYLVYNYYMRLVGNCMPISIYLGTMCWKGTGNELQASKLFWMTSIIFSGKSNFF